jgi:AAA+ ATPase superfamily predicted ATPase
MLEGISNEDKIKYYACVGGTPHYLSQVDCHLSFEENLIDLYFEPQSYLYGEPELLLQQELREPAMYNSIIAAIASGAARLNDISSKINEDSAKVIKYIKTLIDLNILYKDNPFNENPEFSRKSAYRISDNCYRFWYRYVFLNKAGIEAGIGAEIADSLVFPLLMIYIGKPAFEDICRQYLIRQNKSQLLPFLAMNIGVWWGSDKTEKVSADIDIVAENKTTKQILLCECKWRNELTDASEVQKLLAKSKLLPDYDEYYFMFFSKSPYTKAAKQLAAENKNLRLLDLNMIFSDI